MGIEKYDVYKKLHPEKHKGILLIPRYKYNKSIGVDVEIMPVFCNNCNHTQSDLYCHLGSRYGQVGTIYCEKCKSPIYLTDHDNVVTSIIINGKEIDFYELYKLSEEKFLEVEELQKIKFSMLLEGNKEIYLIDLLEKLQEVSKISLQGKYRYITDKRINKLPYEVNLWIEFLEKCGVKNNLYIEKLEMEKNI